MILTKPLLSPPSNPHVALSRNCLVSHTNPLPSNPHTVGASSALYSQLLGNTRTGGGRDNPFYYRGGQLATSHMLFDCTSTPPDWALPMGRNEGGGMSSKNIWRVTCIPLLSLCPPRTTIPRVPGWTWLLDIACLALQSFPTCLPPPELQFPEILILSPSLKYISF